MKNILEVVCRTTGMGFAAVARVTDTQWMACAVLDRIGFGLLPGGELELESTICNEIRQSGNAVLIDHVDKDPVFCGHHTPARYGFQSYISVPIFLKDGEFFGTLCAIDPRPARVSTLEVKGMFDLFAELIAFQLDANYELGQKEASLIEERRISELREQFIAILGHDLRNPLGAISGSAQLLERIAADDKSKHLVSIIKGSSYRMNELIENMLDFARGRMGGGITLNQSKTNIRVMLEEVIGELQAIWPERIIEADLSADMDIMLDPKRMAQLFSNLLGNALTHGKRDTPVTVIVQTSDKRLSLCVSNKGKRIPDNIMDQLFKPFSRGDVASHQKGLGLGLYIASEIARAHGGTLTATSDDDRTRFTFELPL